MTTIDDVLRARAELRADEVGFTFLPRGDIARAEDLDYGALYHRASKIAAYLMERGLEGEPVYLIYNDGLEFPIAFAACALAGAVAVPMYGPERGHVRALARLESAHERADGKLVLTSAFELSNVRELIASSPALCAVDVVASDAIEIDADLFRGRRAKPDDLAFLLLTSGSTSASRCVAVTHANALAQCAYLGQGFDYRPGRIHVGWPPVCNTGGFVFTILNPLCTGFRSVRLPTLAFLGRPATWLEAISHYRATHGHGPNFAYDLCVRSVSLEEKAGLDLSSWEHAINGAEPIRPATLDRFADAFRSCGFRRGAFSLSYGLSEATMQVARSGRASGPQFYQADASLLQATGRALEATPDTAVVRSLPLYSGHGELHREIAIVDPDTRVECEPGVEGEIWVAGDDVAVGYLADPAATAETFGQRTDDGRGPFLRTGDLGFTAGDQLCVSGRLKDVIIIRGANHSPHELEWTATRSHWALDGEASAAFSVATPAAEQLVVAVEIGVDLDYEEIARIVRESVAREHLLYAWSVVLVPRGAIPRTPNGKIMRAACRRAYLDRSLSMIFEGSLEASVLHHPGVFIDGEEPSGGRS